jgi:hypothetical protein
MKEDEVCVRRMTGIQAPWGTAEHHGGTLIGQGIWGSNIPLSDEGGTGDQLTHCVEFSACARKYDLAIYIQTESDGAGISQELNALNLARCYPASVGFNPHSLILNQTLYLFETADLFKKEGNVTSAVY